MAVYDPTIKVLGSVPQGKAVNLVVRHSERYPILKAEDVPTAPLTPQGIRIAEEFGAALKQNYRLGVLESSEIARCVETAAAIGRGARWKGEVRQEPRFTYTYTDDYWHTRREHLFADALPDEVIDLLDYLKNFPAKKHSLNISVTHDSVLGVLAGYLFNDFVDGETWPHFLEGMAIWRENGNVFAAWRNQVKSING
jgi:histidine phosphatase superfamily protein (branch 1)